MTSTEQSIQPATRSGAHPPVTGERRAPEAMAEREFHTLAAEVAAVFERHGVPTWLIEDRVRLEAALWGAIHPDLAGTPRDPYREDDEDEEEYGE